MSRDEQQIEQEIQAKNLNAPRLTPQLIDAVIVGEDYYVFPNTTVTVCCLKLKNGFTTIGHSASASALNFDESIGRKLAREAARQHIWQLEGYLLKQQLFSQSA